MAKKVKKYPIGDDEEQSLVNEPLLEYQIVKKVYLPKEYSYKKFEGLMRILPFSLKEWANILDLSERTLQRYARDNKGFEGIYNDRLLHIEQLAEAGLETFANSEAFYNWLKKDKLVFGQPLNFDALYTTRGIQNLINQLIRIQQGVYS